MTQKDMRVFMQVKQGEYSVVHEENLSSHLSATQSQL